MIEVQFRREPFNETQSWHIWYRLGKFNSIFLAIQGIVTSMNESYDEDLGVLTVNDFNFSHNSEGWPAYELKTAYAYYQIRFVKTQIPDGPWKIGLNDV